MKGMPRAVTSHSEGEKSSRSGSALDLRADLIIRVFLIGVFAGS